MPFQVARAPRRASRECAGPPARAQSPKECAGSLFAFNHSSVLILEGTAQDDDPINEVPNSQTSQRQNHSDSGTCFPNVEPVSAENAKEPAKQKGSQPVLAAGGRFLFGEGFAPTIRNRLEAAPPKAPHRQGGVGSPLRVWGENKCASLRRGLRSGAILHTERYNRNDLR